MDLISDEYLQPNRFTDKELAERGGSVIPEEAASIVREFQRMQKIEKPYLVSIQRTDLKQDVQIKHISAGTNHALSVSV